MKHRNPISVSMSLVYPFEMCIRDIVKFIIIMLESHDYKDMVEACCDEAGRGCLAGSVYAAAVILPPGYQNAELNDRKKLTDQKRKALREQIERDAVAWADVYKRQTQTVSVRTWLT